MTPERRNILQAILATVLMPSALSAQADGGETLIRINIPGPNSLPFLPIELIQALNFDREVGARLVVRYQPSGIHAIEDVLAGNADLAGLGFSTLPVLHANGKDVVAIAPLAGRTIPVSLVVRKDLVKTVRRVADLKGRTIGTSTGSINSSKTYMQMAAQLLLAAHGVADNQVRWLATAQNWQSLSGAMISASADAVMCEEPFSSRLVKHGLGSVLVDLSAPAVAAKIPGLDHLRTAIATRRGLLQSQPEKMELFVRMLRRTLVWMQATPPEQVAQQAMADTAEGRLEIATLLRRLPGIYSTDARFSVPQVAATDTFLSAMLLNTKLMAADRLIDDRWAGRQQ